MPERDAFDNAHLLEVDSAGIEHSFGHDSDEGANLLNHDSNKATAMSVRRKLKYMRMHIKRTDVALVKVAT